MHRFRHLAIGFVLAVGLQSLTRRLLLALTGIARFDDRAVGSDGEDLYSNQTLILVRTKWGKVFEQRDFYVDTERITEFDRKLTELGIEAAS
jgi:hypothetical protein